MCIDSTIRHQKRKIEPSKKTLGVENRYAKWMRKIEMLGKTKKAVENCSPQLPRIELCWL